MSSSNMLARQNTHGVSVNESAVCVSCLASGIGVEDSFRYWADAEDTNEEGNDDQLYPVDNPDALCNGCGTATVWED